MSVRAITWAFEQTATKGTEKLVLLALADNANDDGECWPGRKFIAAKTGLGASSITRHLTALEGKGLLEREQRFRDDGSRASNNYKLSMGSAQSEQGISASASRHEPSVEPSENQTPVSPKSSKRLDLRDELGFYEFLEHHEKVTGDKPPRKGTKALNAIAKSFCLRREDYTLEELKGAVDAAYADEFRRKNGHYGLESVLRPTKVNALVVQGRRLQPASDEEDDIAAREAAYLAELA